MELIILRIVESIGLIIMLFAISKDIIFIIPTIIFVLALWLNGYNTGKYYKQE